MSETEKDLRIKPFNGKQDDWRVWSRQFLVRASRKGYRKILEGKETAPTDDEVKAADETTEPGKEVLKKRGLNNAAYEALLLLIDGRSVSGQVAFNIVSGCTTDKMEEGDAELAWSRLMKKYEPKTAPSRLMLKRKLTGMVLKSVRDDPDVWLTDLEHVKGQLIAAGSKMTDDELLEHALN
eukprot:scaffold8463_cov134-Cylindrotheca_fusiformis.AAC.1